MSKIMIVGGAGFIGSNLAKHLISKGHAVLVYDQAAKWNHAAFTPEMGYIIDHAKRWEYSYRLRSIEGASCWTGNERSKESLYTAACEFEPEFVYYAGGISVPAEVNFQTLPQMIEGFSNVYNLFSSTGSALDLERFIFLSSSLVYNKPYGQYPVLEYEERNSPSNLYGVAKNTCESILESGDVPFSTARLCGVYGSGDGNRRVLDKLICKALYGQDLWVKPGIVNAFTHIDDVVKGLSQMIYSPDSTIYNLTNREAVSLEHAAMIIAKKLNSPSKISFLSLEPSDVSKGPFDISLAKKDLGFEPEIDFLSGIDSYINHIQLREGMVANQ